MASGHVERRIQRPDTWQLRPAVHQVNKALANTEPSTHGAERTFSRLCNSVERSRSRRQALPDKPQTRSVWNLRSFPSLRSVVSQHRRRTMPTTKLPDNGHTVSQRIAQQQTIPLGMLRNEEIAAEPVHVDDSVGGLHRQIHDALKTTSFKQDAAGKSGEALKLAVAAAIAGEKILVEIVSVGLADTAESYASTPYEAVWQTAPDAVHQRSYFGV